MDLERRGTKLHWNIFQKYCFYLNDVDLKFAVTESNIMKELNRPNFFTSNQQVVYNAHDKKVRAAQKFILYFKDPDNFPEIRSWLKHKYKPQEIDKFFDYLRSGELDLPSKQRLHEKYANEVQSQDEVSSKKEKVISYWNKTDLFSNNDTPPEKSTSMDENEENNLESSLHNTSFCSSKSIQWEDDPSTNCNDQTLVISPKKYYSAKQKVLRELSPVKTLRYGSDIGQTKLSFRKKVPKKRESSEPSFFNFPTINKRPTMRMDDETPAGRISETPEKKESSKKLVNDSEISKALDEDSGTDTETVFDADEDLFDEPVKPEKKNECLEKNHSQYSMKEITPEMIDYITNELKNEKDKRVAVKFEIGVTTEELRQLYFNEWIADRVIDLYLEMIQARSIEDSSLPSVFIFQTFFYRLLVANGAEDPVVQSCSMDKNIFEYDLVIVPVNRHSHWILVVLDNKIKKLTVYDSKNHNNTHTLKPFKAFLSYFKKTLRQKDPDAKLPNFPDYKARQLNGGDELPEQVNAYDCGVFMCQFAEHLSRREPFNFCERDMKFFRKKIAYEILTFKFHL